MVMQYEELEVWQQAMDWVILVYQETRRFPREEIYGLTSQIRRAAVSVPSNIAEGQGRRSTKEFLNHLAIARGSLFEVETQVKLATRLDYLTHERTRAILDNSRTVGRLLNGLIRALEKKL